MSRRVPAFVTKHANLERMWNFGMFVMERIDKASLKQVASSLTLTTLLSIVPALAVIMAAFSAFPLFAPYREAFEQFIFSTLLPEDLRLHQAVCHSSCRFNCLRFNRFDGIRTALYCNYRFSFKLDL